jgi:hypothetical protein
MHCHGEVDWLIMMKDGFPYRKDILATGSVQDGDTARYGPAHTTPKPSRVYSLQAHAGSAHLWLNPGTEPGFVLHANCRTRDANKTSVCFAV